MQKEAILHIPDSSYAYALDEKTVVLRLRVKKNDLSSCTLFYGDRVCIKEKIEMAPCEMRVVSTDNLYDYFECTLENCYPRICYYFLLESGDKKLYYFSGGFYDSVDYDRSLYYQYAFIRREDLINVPDWAKQAVIYQIFPDSFATSYRSISNKDVLDLRCNGGTIKGIIDNIDYIKKLGVNCLYLNPIFKAKSYHRYDTIDYYSVDENIGTNDEFKELVKSCHKNGIRILLDGVFNHCGADFFAFKDVCKNGEKSIYKDWFYQLEFPVKYKDPPNYMAFAYEKKMPKLNTGNPEVEKYFIDVGTYWIKEYDIDGWRLDVANEINHGFWRNFRKAVKSAKSDALLIGEIWEDAQEWLRGDQFDSTMNYRFMNLCNDFFATGSISATIFSQQLNSMLMRYSTPMSQIQMNLLDSHDVPRFLTKCSGDIDKLKLAMLFMLSFVGIPSIFYGNEVLISGETESEYRSPMRWKPSNSQLKMIDYVSTLIKIRNSHSTLTDGTFICIDTGDENVLAFERKNSEESLLVIINNSYNDYKLSLPHGYSQKECSIVFSENSSTNTCKAMSGMIISLS